MKKLLLFFALVLSTGALFAQTDCSDLFISEYIEGSRNNKSMELYNPTGAPITLDNVYRLIRWSNGSNIADQDFHYVLPITGTIDPYNVMVIIQDTIPGGQDTMIWLALRKKGTWLAPYDYDGSSQGGRVVFWNGDDAVSLQKKQTNGSWKDIDIFGDIGIQPLNKSGTTSPAGAWTDTKPYVTGQGRFLTQYKTLIRKHTIKHGVDRLTMIHYGDSSTGGTPNSFYALLEYDSIHANFFDSLGQHWCDCKTAQAIGHKQQDNSVFILPNPVTNNQFTVQSSLPIASIEVISIVGKSVYSREYATRQREVKVLLDNFPLGVYLVKVTFNENQSVIKRIILQ